MSPNLPVVTPRKIIQALTKAGFVIDRTSGSHYLLKHRSDPSRRVTVAYHSEDVKRKTLKTILRQAKLGVEEFSELL